METVVIVAIGVLATIFLASFAALVVVCRQRYCRPRDLLQRYDSKPIVDLIGAMETQSEPSELELDDVVITNPHIEAILENEDWIEDASGLMSHCIAILKICHTLTEKLVAMTMGSGAKMKTSASVSDIIVVAKRISPSQGCFPSFCHTFFLGSGPASTFPTGAHTRVCSDLLAGVCTVDQLLVSVLSPPAPSRAQPAASRTGWEVKRSFRSPKFQAVCRIPCGRQAAGL
ncbi:transmembrane protein 98 isoform X1 [Globicephala melas]|uniref:transmembrane protein 98 isoform X1 n=1 Tax=Globicephala melas TaxID=9731 RepID=UPI00293D6FB4|nr:transmembrane protein 98 isoform X1 [Globicephala melas]